MSERVNIEEIDEKMAKEIERVINRDLEIPVWDYAIGGEDYGLYKVDWFGWVGNISSPYVNQYYIYDSKEQGIEHLKQAIGDSLWAVALSYNLHKEYGSAAAVDVEHTWYAVLQRGNFRDGTQVVEWEECDSEEEARKVIAARLGRRNG